MAKTTTMPTTKATKTTPPAKKPMRKPPATRRSVKEELDEVIDAVLEVEEALDSHVRAPEIKRPPVRGRTGPESARNLRDRLQTVADRINMMPPLPAV